VKYFHEDYPLNYRQTELSINEVYKLIWDAGNYALESQSGSNETVRQEISSHFGYLFNLVGQLSLINGNKGILYGQILGPYEQEIDHTEELRPGCDLVDDSDYLKGLRVIELCLNLSYLDLVSKK